MDATQQALVQRRTLQVLFGGTVAARAGISLTFTVATLAVKDMVGSTWAGLATVAATVGAALGASWLSSLMMRRGRNPGLTLGFAAAAVGAVIAVAAVEAGLVVFLLLGLVLVGGASGAAGLARYAAADLAAPARRARDISIIVFASTIGAVGGPTQVGWSSSWAEGRGLDELSGPMVVATVVFVVGAAVVWLGLRPDPLVVSDGLHDPADGPRTGFVEGLRIAWAGIDSRLALMAMVISHAVMVMVMAMTPLHMDAHGHDVGDIGWVISIHTAGMYALAPVAGWTSDRIGRIRSLVVGAVTLLAATVTTAVAVDAPPALMFPGLFLLGLGWSFAVVAGSALLTESVPAEHRVAVQGSADVAMNAAGGAGALAAGVIFSMTGFHVLSLLGTGASAALALMAFTRVWAPSTAPAE